ncbi:MAG: YARHG domain-containing protein [Treponema sp.]|nr:YARHG domain-containing protein [Treponema sp.]
MEEWYKVNPDFNESNLNEIERANVNLIKKYEER